MSLYGPRETTPELTRCINRPGLTCLIIVVTSRPYTIEISATGANVRGRKEPGLVSDEAIADEYDETGRGYKTF